MKNSVHFLCCDSDVSRKAKCINTCVCDSSRVVVGSLERNQRPCCRAAPKSRGGMRCGGSSLERRWGLIQASTAAFLVGLIVFVHLSVVGRFDVVSKSHRGDLGAGRMHGT